MILKAGGHREHPGIHKKAALVGLYGVFLLASPLKAGLIEQEQAIINKHQSEFDQFSELGLNGALRDANQKLLELTQKDKSVAMTLVVANMLYQVDPDTSYALHKRAYEAAPDDEATILEWAMEQHRKGNYSDAASLYQKYLKAEPDDVTKQALLADCLVRIGKYEDAVSTWNAAGHSRNHTGIDFAICEIYGPLSPVRRRDDLLQSIRAGDNSVFEKLIYLDLNYDTDWWNSSINQRALDSDLALAGKSLGTNSIRFQDLLACNNLATNENADDKAIRKVLEQTGLIIGAKGRLPKNSLIARDLVEKAIAAHLATKTDLLGKFEAELSTRSKSKPGDSDALHLLCLLCAGNDNKLAEYDNYGWEHFVDVTFAESYLLGLAKKNKLIVDSPEMKKALVQFPEDGIIRELQMQTVGKGKVTTEMIVAAINAEYRKLSSGLAIPDSYKLNALFRSLGDQLQKK